MGLETATIIALASAAVGAVGAIQTGQQQKAQAQGQAAIQDQQARRDRQVGAVNEANKRRQIARDIGTIRAAQGGGQGSQLLGLEDFASEGELAALTLRSNANAGATRLEQEAQQRRFAGSNAARQGFTRAGASLLKGAGKAFS